jgi:hypothetical protein
MSRLVSPKQREALELLSFGAKIHIVHHMRLETSAFITDPHNPGHKTISLATVEALRVQGWLERTGDPAMLFRGTEYIISAKGLAQLLHEQNEQFVKAPGKLGKDMTPKDWKDVETHLKAMAAKSLKVWNGRGDYREFDGRFYVCAPTKKAAVELLSKAGHIYINMREFNTYYSPCWGNVMNNTPWEIGVWFVDKKDDLKDGVKPRRIL